MLAFSIISVTNPLICNLLPPLAYLSYLYMKNLKNRIVPCCSFLCRCDKIFVRKIISACLEVLFSFFNKCPHFACYRHYSRGSYFSINKTFL